MAYRGVTMIPVNLSRRGGVGGYKSGKFAQVVAASKAHNQLVAANLKLSMAAVPKYLLGAYAATALNEAIKQTKHDSSRFAANWNLALGNKPLLNGGAPLPLKYNESDESFGTIGTKGQKGQWRLRVQTAKRIYYGYEPSQRGSAYMKLTKGKLAMALFPRAGNELQRTKGGAAASLSNVRLSGNDLAGEAPAIYLYNPFMKPGYLRLDGSGRSYPQNALPGEGTQAVTSEVSQVMGGGLLQELLVTLAAQMRMANAQGTIVSPFP